MTTKQHQLIKINHHLICFISLTLITSSYSFSSFHDAEIFHQKQDHIKAINELKPLAEIGDAKAQNLLGKMYYLGQGTPKNIPKGVALLREAAKKGIPEAQGAIGYMHLIGESGALLDIKLAQDWMTKAANQGDVNSQYNLAVMYGGKGIKEDPAKSSHWMRKAAEQGHKYALNNLAFMHQEGKGVAKDLVLAHMMYGISYREGNIAGLKSQKKIAEKMSKTQIKKSTELIKKWQKYNQLPLISKTSTTRKN